MPYSEKKRDYNMQDAKEHLKRIPLDVPLQKYDEIKEAAAGAGETVNGYIKTAIDRRIESERP